MTDLSNIFPDQSNAAQKGQNLADLASTRQGYANLRRPVDKTANYDAVAGDVIDANTSGGSFTVTLPASPADNDTVTVRDAYFSWTTNSLTIGRNGKTIAGKAEDGTCSVGNVAHTFTYKSASGDWFVESNAVTTGESTILAAAPQLLETQIASASAAIEFTTGIDSTYKRYLVTYTTVIPGTDAVDMLLRTSSDGGTTFDSGGSDYGYVTQFAYEYSVADTNSYSPVSGSTHIRLHNATTGNNTGEVFHGSFVLFDPADTSTYKVVESKWRAVGAAGSYVYETGQGIGVRKSTSAVDAVQIIPSSGVISSGEFKLYGVL